MKPRMFMTQVVNVGAHLYTQILYLTPYGMITFLAALLIKISFFKKSHILSSQLTLSSSTFGYIMCPHNYVLKYYHE